MHDPKLTSSEDSSDDSSMDSAVAGRLARLRTMTVDTTRLEQRMAAKIPRGTQTSMRINNWLRFGKALAACLILAAMTWGVVLISSGGTVSASVQQMADIHQDLVSGHAQAQRVTSIADANKLLAGQSEQSLQLPEVPHEQVMACCMKSLHGKRIACVLMDQNGTPITMTLARASEMAMPDAPAVERNGITYHVHSMNGLQMVMTEKHGQWICLIGKVSSEHLMDIADQLQF